MEIIEEVVVKIVPRFFCHNHPKILALCSCLDRNRRTFLDKKKLKPISVSALIFNQQALITILQIVYLIFSTNKYYD
ncbi:hypothetical protein D5R40_06570 [Okeania hirsuta]|uniref:Uncharacterized protein n=1 Tax=Okeania hirsuta TaxID=1458930 RepID=A0A3N6P720_9CYAN|nr:hypothetical protein D4Z78_14760 [Okeania hirsuta]RQH50220.1 hypothetical protein D5R40_06570 [Okeania hirsuta]